MMHDRAAQRISGGRFDYVTGNHRVGTYAVGYCAGWKHDNPPSDYAKRAGLTEMLAMERVRLLPFKDKFHTDGHATAEEACECYRQYILDTRLVFRSGKDMSQKPEAKHLCKAKGGCDQYTANIAVISGDIPDWHLCDAHLNRAEVEKLYKVGESWHS